MAKKIHSQQPDPRSMVCFNCKQNKCGQCVDMLRLVYTSEMICKCTRRGHMGEALEAQIVDPETNTVFAPGLTVSELGEVAVDPDKRQRFLDQFAKYLDKD